MFNWFKKKIELKESSCLMTSTPYHTGIKVNTEINVPENYKCLIYHHSKCYLTLDKGKYTLNSALVQDLFEKQSKYVKSNKRIKAIFHYICLTEQEIEVNIKKVRYVVKLIVDNINRFADFILLYNYKTDAEYTNYCLKDLLQYYISSISNEKIALYNQQLQSYGFKILKINPKHSSTKSNTLIDLNRNCTTASTHQPVNAHSPQTILNEKPSQINDYGAIPNSSNEYSNISKQETQCVKNISSNCSSNSSTTLSKCPKCQNEIKFKTTYCLRCGYKLE